MPRGQQERLFHPNLRGPMLTDANSDDYQWAGRTTLGSGSATVTVSTAVVNSDSLILMGSQAATNQASGVSTPIEVKSIDPGNHFIIGTADGDALARDTDIMWMVMPTSDPG